MSRIPIFVFLFDFKYSQGQKQQSTWLNLPGGCGNSCGGGWQPCARKGLPGPWAAQEPLHRFVSVEGDLGETRAWQGGNQRPKRLRTMESLSKQCGWDDGLGMAQGAEGAWQAGLATS